MNIYQLAGELMRLQAMLEAGPEDDTYDAGFVEAKMSETAEEIVAKADGYARIIRNLSALAAELENEKNRLAKRQKTAEGAVKRLKDMLQAAMEEMGIEKIQTGIGKWYLQNNPMSVLVEDWHRLPERFLVPQEPKIDKTAILAEHRQTGEVFDGCEIVQTRGIRFR